VSALVLGVALLLFFELVWANVPVLRQHRAHFRGMLALFWATVLAIFAADAWNLAPRLFFNGIPRFASDAATYQHQASVLADGLRSGSMAAFVDHQAFNYSRLLAVLYLVFGHHALVGNVFNAVFFLTSVIAIFLIARRLFDDRVGICAAWVLACWPTFLLHETQTLRWGSTAAGLHVAVLGTILLVSTRRWGLGFLLAIMGFGVLVADLPYIARLFVVAVMAYTLAVLLFPSVGRRRYMAAARLAVFVVTASVWYQLVWAPLIPTPMSEPQFRSRASSTRTGRDGRFFPQDGRFLFLKLEDLRIQIEDLRIRIVDRLDAAVFSMLAARSGFIRDAWALRQQGVAVGTAIDGPELVTFADFIRNLPAAYGVALFEPTIPRLLADGGGSSRIRKIVVIEMVAYYTMLVMSMLGAALAIRTGGWTRIQAVFIVILLAGVYAALGTTIMNGGTLHRLRQPYVAFQCVFAAAACSWLLSHANAEGRWLLRLTREAGERVEAR
jgi:hypothetical protein